jgi:hypothetical protein
MTMAHEGFEDDDPMGLVGMVLPGEPGQLELMAECFIEEYVRLGWNEARLMTLFVNPMFLATHRIYRAKGEAYVRDLIRQIRSKWGADRICYPVAQPDLPPNCSLVADPAAPTGSPFTA